MIKPLQLIQQAFLEENDPRGISRGIAWGAFVGCLPTGNLAWVLAWFFVLLLRLNLLSLFATAAVFLLIGEQLDVVFAPVGKALLSFAPLQACLGYAFQWPLMGWSGLDNTVVVGAIVVGTVLRIPAQWLLFRYLKTNLSTAQNQPEGCPVGAGESQS